MSAARKFQPTRRLIAASLQVSVMFVACTPSLAQPLNDSCASPTTLPPNTSLSGTTLGATSDLPQSCGLGDSLDVWYRFKAPVAAEYAFDTNGSLVDTVLAVYADCASLATPLACNDDDPDATDFSSRVTVNLTTDQIVRIRVAANVADEGGFTLRSTGGLPPPANDECTGQLPVILPGVATTGNSEGATTSVELPDALCGTSPMAGGGSDVFFRFTPLISGPHAVLTCGSGFDTVISIHSGCPADASNLLTCNDDADPPCSQNNVAAAIPSIELSVGHDYVVRLAGFNGLTGPYTIIINLISAGSGACCRGSACVIVAQGVCTGSNFQFAGLNTVCNLPNNVRIPCCRGDFNKVGGVTVQDIFDFLVAYFANSPLADTNDSGAVTVQDVFDYLVGYFAGCA